MNSKLAKYKIGLAVIGLFTLVILIMVVMEAGSTKQDNNTYTAANNITNKLNNYVENNDSIPDSLSVAGAYNVPSTISYTKLSDTSYRFCVDYKTTSDDFSPSAAETSLITSSGHGSEEPVQTAASDGFLILEPNHHKGNNCQTVTIFTGLTNLNSQTD